MIEEKPIFILTTGRTGSTFLQRILNCSNDILIWGEHGGFIRGLKESYYSFTDQRKKFIDECEKYKHLLLSGNCELNRKNEMSFQWCNHFETANIEEYFRSFIQSFFIDNESIKTRWGFKELLYGKQEKVFLKKLWPNSKFLYLIRDPSDILKSKYKAFAKCQMDKMRSHLERTKAFFAFVESESCNFYEDGMVVLYEELVNNLSDELKRLENFLETKFDSQKIELLQNKRKPLIKDEDTDVFDSLLAEFRSEFKEAIYSTYERLVIRDV